VTDERREGLAITVRGLTKSYGSLQAVRGIDLEIGRGEVFALLGPNGAGKTTTVEILEGYRNRDAGEVRVLGFDPADGDREMKARIGIVLQSTGIDPYLTVAESVDMYSGYYPNPRPVDEVIDLVGLTAKRGTRVIKLSGGQQRRLDVGIALAGDPEILFLDEPTTGFDPSARRGAWEVVKNLAALGKTVLLTTHYMDEAQYLADRVAVIASGRIVAEGPPSTLSGRDQAKTRISFVLPDGVAPPHIDDVDGVTAGGAGLVGVVTAEPTRVLHDLTGWAVERNIELSGIEVRRPSLEDVYLELTGDQPAEETVEPASAGRGRRRRR
jgi:ABC-2 type transport system ATP-binding protein